ncbi:ABC transporter permease [Pseudonocardia kunmingensis]|uniref:Peptide/nickel transport system permease protein n=1 Tax=Pseudonocardia kunmingensis TaxID=630975 RepID=A0A543DPX6_9PSEU|nr:ABC transporter permease [Pseudonocardia kunmingensis]TQM11358.1 peptide/nickel transport system permease protein [Pseudonocardia kunmingensis]
MSTPEITTEIAASAAAGPRIRRERSPLLERVLDERAAIVAAGFLILIAVVALLAPVLAPTHYAAIDLDAVSRPPGATHWLGTDELGRDVFSRFLYGARTSLLAALQAVAVALLIGLPLGLAAGYLGGLVDTILSRLNDAVMSAPALILAVAVVAVLGPGLTNAMLAIGIVFAPSLFRIVRGATLAVRAETYIEASRAIGCTPLRIMVRHVLLNIVAPVVAQISILLGVTMLAEASLSFLGLGVSPPLPSWGSLLREAFDNLYTAPYLVYAPGIAIGLTVLALSQLGDGVRTALSAGRRRS